MKLGKKCVFCGERPLSKTKEHVLPMWLIKMTGDRNRQIKVGFMSDKRLSINNFVFPACDICNSDYAKIEGKVKPVISKLLELKGINGEEAEILLEWFDKIRIGHWLAGLMLFKNPSLINPKYYIGSRSGKKDRILYIGREEHRKKGLHFSAMDNPVFDYLPCVMTLYLNGLHFINASTDGLCGAAMGFPKIKAEKYEGRTIICEIRNPPRPGWKENWPAAPKGFSILAQAIYPASVMEELRKEADKLGEDLGYRQRMQSNMSRSRVHVYSKGNLRVLSEEPLSVLPPAFKDPYELWKKVAQLFFKLQDHIANKVRVPTKDKRQRAELQMVRKAANEFFRICLRKIEEEKKRRGKKR